MEKDFLFLPAPLAFGNTCVSKEYSRAAGTDLAAKVCTMRRRFLRVLERHYADMQTVAFSNQYDYFYESSETHS